MSNYDEIDPQWEGILTVDAPEVENRGLPEMIHLLEYEMPSTLRGHGIIAPRSPMREASSEQSLSPMQPLSSPMCEASLRPSSSLMYDASSKPSSRLRSDSEPVSDESRATKFPAEEPFLGINKLDPRFPPITEVPSDTTGSESSVLLASDDNRRHRPWVKLQHEDQDDEITPAPPLWDQEGADTPPRRAGAGPGAFNPDPSARNTRTLRQRVASARQTLREIVQEDREWIREAMVRIGIRSYPQDGENERPPTRRPEFATEQRSRREKSSVGAAIKARVTPYLSLRGGSGTPPGEQPQDNFRRRGQSEDNTPQREHSPGSWRPRGPSLANTRPREQPEDNPGQRGRPQDNNRPGGLSQDNYRPSDQSRSYNSRSYNPRGYNSRGYSYNSQNYIPPSYNPHSYTPPREDRHNSGTEIPERRPLLSPSRQLHSSFTTSTPQEERRKCGGVFDLWEPPSPPPQNSFSTTPPPREERRDSGAGSFDLWSSPPPSQQPHNAYQNTSWRREAGNSEPGPSSQGPSISRAQYYRHSSHGEQGTVDCPQRSRPSEYTHPLARLDVFEDDMRTGPREPPEDSAARQIFEQSPYARPPTRRELDEFATLEAERRQRNEDMGLRLPSYNDAVGNNAGQCLSQNTSQNASKNLNQNASQNQTAGQSAGQSAGQNASQDVDQNGNQNGDPPNIDRNIPSPLLEDPVNSRVHLGRRRRGERRDFSTFSRDTGKKIKENMTKFATLRRKFRAPAPEPVGGVLEPLTLESKNPTPPPAAPGPEAALLPPPVPAPTADPEPGVTVHEEVYSKNSLSRGFNMWPFNRKRRHVSKNF